MVGELDTKYLYALELLLNNAKKQQKEMYINVKDIDFEQKATEEKEEESKNLHILFDVINLDTQIELTNQSNKLSPEFKIRTSMDFSLSETQFEIEIHSRITRTGARE